MRKILLLVIFVNLGCVSESLRDQTVSQVMSLADIRYQEALDNLAIVASNGGILPAFAVASGGVANVTNSVSADASTAFNATVNGFSQELLNSAGTHNPELQWTVAPVTAEPNVEALHYACLWAVYGRPAEGSQAMELLRAVTPADVNTCNTDRPPGFHFNVASQLDALPPCWLHVGSRGDVPRHVCYKSHCGKTYVWVTADGLEGLSSFTLVLLDIATTDPKSLVLSAPLVKLDIQYGTTAPPAAPNTPVASFAPTAAPAPTSAPKWTGSGPKITEQWYACQEFTVGGGSTISILRPPWIKDPFVDVTTLKVIVPGLALNTNEAAPVPPLSGPVPMQVIESQSPNRTGGR
jgi:hypothetical protein